MSRSSRRARSAAAARRAFQVMSGAGGGARSTTMTEPISIRSVKATTCITQWRSHDAKNRLLGMTLDRDLSLPTAFAICRQPPIIAPPGCSICCRRGLSFFTANRPRPRRPPGSGRESVRDRSDACAASGAGRFRRRWHDGYRRRPGFISAPAARPKWSRAMDAIGINGGDDRRMVGVGTPGHPGYTPGQRRLSPGDADHRRLAALDLAWPLWPISAQGSDHRDPELASLCPARRAMRPICRGAPRILAGKHPPPRWRSSKAGGS